MIITDPEAIKLLQQANSTELLDMIADYPDADPANEWSVIAHEAGMLLDAFNSCDTAQHDDLEESRTTYARFCRQRRKGNKLSHFAYLRADRARDTINEYNRLKALVRKLKARGLECPYC